MKKGIFDVVLASAGVVAFALPMAVVYGLVRLKLGAPVIFKQERLGQNGQPFTNYKFRTMHEACGSDGKPLPDDERSTAFGDVLRKFKLDEMPQVFNILKGDMSIVGPRPRAYPPIHPEDVIKRTEILNVKPGLSSPAVIRSAEQGVALSLLERERVDAAYARRTEQRPSLRRDLCFVWGTLGALAGRAPHTYEQKPQRDENPAPAND